MIAVVFKGKEITVHEKSPTTSETKKDVLLCVIGKQYQKWYFWTKRGWVMMDGYNVRPYMKKQLKMVCLSMGITYPETSKPKSFWG